MKKKNIVKARIQAIATDLLFWMYLLGCLYYLFHKWTGFTARLTYVGIAAVVITILFQILKISIGVKIFLASKKVKKGLFKSAWGYCTIIALIITFIVGVNIVGVDFYKFFTKFQNAGGIASGIFDPSITGYSLTKQSVEDLQKDNIPSDVLSKLTQVQNRKYSTKKVFLDDIEKRIGKADLQCFPGHHDVFTLGSTQLNLSRLLKPTNQ